jgi:hypothetical protein
MPDREITGGVGEIEVFRDISDVNHVTAFAQSAAAHDFILSQGVWVPRKWDQALAVVVPANAAFMDLPTADFAGGGRFKTLHLAVTTAFAWATSGTPTIRLYTRPGGYTGGSGAATTLPTGANNAPFLTAAMNMLAVAGVALALGHYFISPNESSFPSVASAGWPVLQDFHRYLGVEINWPSAPTAGVMTAEWLVGS